MDLALYHPKYGYYSSSKQKIGKEGDFYTSSSVGSIYGVMWAKHFIHTWQQLGILDQTNMPLVMLEIGGGNGDFATSILDEFHRNYPEIYERCIYYICEQSHYHRSLQLKKLADHVDRIRVIHQLTDIYSLSSGKPTIVFSNELFDALPVARIKRTIEGFKECWIEVQDDHLSEIWIPLNNADLEAYIHDMKVDVPIGHIVEISLAAKTVYGELLQCIHEGYIFTVDYGWKNDELIRPERRDGTLIGYDHHQHVTDIYQRPGEVDLTTHVHFDALIHWGESYGLETVSYQTQREWLMKEGILSQLQGHQDPNPFSAIAKQNRAIVQLISPGGMGDTFKVLTQRRIFQV